MTARRPPLRPRARGAVTGGVLLALVSAVACGGSDDGADADRVRLDASLSFLDADFQFTSDQVGCVREQLERRVPPDQIAGLDRQLQGVDAGIVAIDDLPADQGEAVTAAIATCAVAE